MKFRHGNCTTVHLFHRPFYISYSNECHTKIIQFFHLFCPTGYSYCRNFSITIMLSYYFIVTSNWIPCRASTKSFLSFPIVFSLKLLLCARQVANDTNVDQNVHNFQRNLPPQRRRASIYFINGLLYPSPKGSALSLQTKRAPQSSLPER